MNRRMNTKSSVKHGYFTIHRWDLLCKALLLSFLFCLTLSSCSTSSRVPRHDRGLHKGHSFPYEYGRDGRPYETEKMRKEAAKELRKLKKDEKKYKKKMKKKYRKAVKRAKKRYHQ